VGGVFWLVCCGLWVVGSGGPVPFPFSAPDEETRPRDPRPVVLEIFWTETMRQ
jgi:hypothetical protein